MHPVRAKKFEQPRRILKDPEDGKKKKGTLMQFGTYETDGFHDEMFEANGEVRSEARLLLETIESLPEGQLQRCQRAAERLLIQLGITFNVYGDSAGTERVFPFDLIPRIIPAAEWAWTWSPPRCAAWGARWR